MDNYFTQTSDLPYERHRYKIIYHDDTTKMFSYYEDATREWYQNKDTKIIEVLDKKNKKNRGFKL